MLINKELVELFSLHKVKTPPSGGVFLIFGLTLGQAIRTRESQLNDSARDLHPWLSCYCGWSLSKQCV